MLTKFCSRCKDDKSITDFVKNKTRKDGYSSLCKFCQRELSKLHYESNKTKYLNRNRKTVKTIQEKFQEFKSVLKCSKCGYSKCPGALHFHHADPSSKEMNISKAIYLMSKQRLQEEIDKCELVCANCHAEIHYGIH